MPIPEGVKKQIDLSKAGFSPEEIDAWRSDTAQSLLDAGFTTKDIGEYFGEKDPDMSGFKKTIEDNLAKAPPKEAQTFKEAIEAGYQMSVWGLIERGEVPDVVLPEHAPMFYKIASGLSGLAGDVPAMLAGGYAGGEAGTVAGGAVGGVAGTFVFPGVGTAAGAATGATVGATVGAGAGAFALPAAIRTHLMQQYEKGDVKDFNDFWERSAVTFIEAAKQGAVGAATAGVGAGVAKVAAPIASAGVKTTAKLSSEVATMTTLGAALEGHAPQPEDFIMGAATVGIMHGAIKSVGAAPRVASKFRDIYAKTGIKPEVLAEQAQNDVIIRQDLVAETPVGIVPESILKENGVKVETEVSLGKPASETAQAPKEGEPGPIPERPEAVQKILSQIGEREKPKSSIKYSFDEFYTDYVDRLNPFSMALKALNEDPAKLAAIENPTTLARFADDAPSKARYMIENGTIDFKSGATNGESFDAIIKPLGKDSAAFDAFLAAKRVPDLEIRGIKSGFDVESAKEVVRIGNKTYGDAADRLTKYQNRVLDYATDSGLLSKEQNQAFKRNNPNYVPYGRILESVDTAEASKQGKYSSLKEIKGSDLKITSPLKTIIENTAALVKRAERNRPLVKMIEIAEKNPEQELFTRVTTTRAIEIGEKEMQRAFKEQGIEADAEAFTTFISDKKLTLAENEFAIWRNGKREIWKTDIPGFAEAVKAVQGNAGSVSLATKLMQSFTNVKKWSLTVVPDFQLRNAFRDQIQAGSLSKGGLRPFIDVFPAIMDLVTNSENAKRWLKSGGSQGAFYEINDRYIQKRIFELDKETTFIKKTWNTVQNAADMVTAIGRIIEQAPRLAEFKKVSKGAAEGPLLFEGGAAAREVTLDFSRMGAKVSAWNSIRAFTAIQINSFDRTVRALKADPVGMGVKGMALITVPSLYLTWANLNDERVKALPRWQRDLFWIIPTDKWEVVSKEQLDTMGLVPDHLLRTNSQGETEINNGAIIRIPKPGELGLLFGTIPERIFEAFLTDNPDAMKDFGHTMAQTFSPSLIPDAVIPIVEQVNNKSYFTGNKILPAPMEGIVPEFQYTEYTSETAKGLAKLIRQVPGAEMGDLPIGSPVVVENYIRGWSGNLGMYALQLADTAAIKAGVVTPPPKPEDTLADIPFVKAFIARYPSMNSQQISDFYSSYQKHSKEINTVSFLKSTGQFEQLTEYVGREEVADNLIKLTGINDTLKKNAHYARIIHNMPDIPPDEKRQLLDGVYYGMIETAKMGNDLMEEIEQSQKENR